MRPWDPIQKSQSEEGLSMASRRFPKPESVSKDEIPEILTGVMNAETLPVGPDLVRLLALWGLWMKGRGFSGGTGDWFVRFLRWALKGRVKAFVEWVEAHPSADGDLALAGIRQVYDFAWPHNASCGYTFHAMWGWLQLELVKPGEKPPPSVEEQMDHITRDLAAQGMRVKGWASLGPGGVMGIPEQMNAPEPSHAGGQPPPHSPDEEVANESEAINRGDGTPALQLTESTKSITWFEVFDGCTLRMADHIEPQTRAEFYDHVSCFWSSSPEALAEAMGECQPLAWEVYQIYSDDRNELLAEMQATRVKGNENDCSQLTMEARLLAMPEEPEEGVVDWLMSLTNKAFEDRVVPQINMWFKALPEWNFERDHLPMERTAQGAALQFIFDLSEDALERLGIVVVDGEHPGSSYFAAELRGDIDEANCVAESVGIPVRFRAAQD